MAMTTLLDLGLSQIAIMAWGKGKPGFGHAHHFQGLGRGHRLKHGRGVGQAHILAGVGNQPPGDNARIHPGIDHARKPSQAASLSDPLSDLQKALNIS